ncbi:MAG: hypothetical protein WCO28_01150 [Bacteroidota bacterium]
MKKIFTLTILSLMLVLTIVNSCTKSPDTTPTPTPTPTPTVIGADTNTLILDGTVPLTIGCLAPQCNVGQADIFTMFMVSNDNQKQFTITTLPVPTVSGTYFLKPQYPGTPYPADQMQMTYKDLGTNLTYTAQTGTATVTVKNGFVKVSFSKITFVKVSSIVLSGTVVCE